MQPVRESLGVSVSRSQCAKGEEERPGRSRKAGTEGHPRSPRRGLRIARRGVTRGHAGPRGNKSDSSDLGLLPLAAQSFPGDQRGLFSYLANLWQEGRGRESRGGTASGDGGRGGGS